jgi:hypothetical protein
VIDPIPNNEPTDTCVVDTGSPIRLARKRRDKENGQNDHQITSGQ